MLVASGAAGAATAWSGVDDGELLNAATGVEYGFMEKYILAYSISNSVVNEIKEGFPNILYISSSAHADKSNEKNPDRPIEDNAERSTDSRKEEK